MLHLEQCSFRVCIAHHHLQLCFLLNTSCMSIKTSQQFVPLHCNARQVMPESRALLAVLPAQISLCLVKALWKGETSLEFLSYSDCTDTSIL